MTGMLASVNSAAEALQVLAAGVDIIDLKQPSQGALGALAVHEVAEIVKLVDQRKPVSATIGDLPMQAQLVFDAVQAMAGTGVNYIKIGFFPGGDLDAVMAKLNELTSQKLALIAVLFADTQPDVEFLLPQLKQTGFSGVMLDTMDKQRGSLLQIMPISSITEFVSLAKQHRLLCGLAGSLRIADIAGLLSLKADYLGFRGALCQQQQRVAKLDAAQIQRIRAAIYAETAVHSTKLV